MTRHKPVQRVHQHRRSYGSQDPAEGAGQPDLGQESQAPAAVAGKQAPVEKDEPPAFATRLLGHGREQALRFLVGQREQRQLFTPVDRGDDPRRPPAELSASRIEQNWASKARRCRDTGIRDLRHPKERTRASSWGRLRRTRGAETDRSSRCVSKVASQGVHVVCVGSVEVEEG
jgi:hypothetical protein